MNAAGVWWPKKKFLCVCRQHVSRACVHAERGGARRAHTASARTAERDSEGYRRATRCVFMYVSIRLHNCPCSYSLQGVSRAVSQLAARIHEGILIILEICVGQQRLASHRALASHLALASHGAHAPHLHPRDATPWARELVGSLEQLDRAAVVAAEAAVSAAEPQVRTQRRPHQPGP